jgi:hypothetical protein
MVRSRYTGSDRVREAGLSATHKQDFNAHVTGGDWIHPASHISVTGAYANAQVELDYLEASLGVLSEAVINTGISINNSVALFSGTTGKLIISSSITIDPVWGDIILPTGTEYNIISAQDTNSAVQGQSLRIFAQSNSGGQGGDLVLGSGYNSISGLYDGKITLFTSHLAFDSTISSPVFAQSNTATTPNDLRIAAQTSYSTSATPSDLWLEAGLNGLGQSGNIYLYSYPGATHVIGTGIVFDTSLYSSAPVITQQDAVTGNGLSFYISAQQATVGLGGDLWLSSGWGDAGSGGIYLNAQYDGFVNVTANSLVFDTNCVNPVISQNTIDAAAASDLYISAQSNTTGTPGDLWLSSGYSSSLNEAGTIYLYADDGGVLLHTSELTFGADYINPVISQKVTSSGAGQSMEISAQGSNVSAGGSLWLAGGVGDGGTTIGNIYLYAYNLLFDSLMPTPKIGQVAGLGGVGIPLTIEAQSSPDAKGGDIKIYSGYGYTSYPPAADGDDGNIDIFSGNGRVNIGGTAYNGSGGVNLMGIVFLPNSDLPPTPPVNGSYIYSYVGNLYCMGTDGISHQLNV